MERGLQVEIRGLGRERVKRVFFGVNRNLTSPVAAKGSIQCL